MYEPESLTKGDLHLGWGFYCSGKQGRDQLHWSETKAKQLLQDLWLALQTEHSFSMARKMLYCTLSQADAWQNKLNHSLPPLSTRTRLCSTSLDEILIQPVKERYPQPSIRDLSVQTSLWRITFALSPAGKALVFLFPPSLFWAAMTGTPDFPKLQWFIETSST